MYVPSVSITQVPCLIKYTVCIYYYPVLSDLTCYQLTFQTH